MAESNLCGLTLISQGIFSCKSGSLFHACLRARCSHCHGLQSLRHLIQYIQEHDVHDDGKHSTEAPSTGRTRLKSALGKDWMRDPYTDDHGVTHPIPTFLTALRQPPICPVTADRDDHPRNQCSDKPKSKQQHQGRNSHPLGDCLCLISHDFPARYQRHGWCLIQCI